MDLCSFFVVVLFSWWKKIHLYILSPSTLEWKLFRNLKPVWGDCVWVLLLSSCWPSHDRCQRYSNECQSTFQGAMLRTNHWSGPSYGGVKPRHPELPTTLFMFKRVKKINQCQCLFPFEANKVHTVWPCPTEHHFVPSHCRPTAALADPPAVALVRVKGAFGVW